jgi:hypothetical protein
MVREAEEKVSELRVQGFATHTVGASDTRPAAERRSLHLGRLHVHQSIRRHSGVASGEERERDLWRPSNAEQRSDGSTRIQPDRNPARSSSSSSRSHRSPSDSPLDERWWASETTLTSLLVSKSMSLLQPELELISTDSETLRSDD